MDEDGEKSWDIFLGIFMNYKPCVLCDSKKVIQEKKGERESKFNLYLFLFFWIRLYKCELIF